MEFLAKRRKALFAALAWVVQEATVVNTLHPDPKVTVVLTVLGLLGVGAVHQATNNQ